MSASVLLVVPPARDPAILWSLSYRHLGVAYLAAALRRAGHRVQILDANQARWDEEQTIAAIRSVPADVIGFSVLQRAAQPCVEIARELRRAGDRPFLVAGGHFPTLVPELLLGACPEIDCVVRGEGEVTLLELVEALAAGRPWQDLPGLAYSTPTGVHRTANRPLIANLDDWPFPDPGDSLAVAQDGRPVGIVVTSRGCYGSCSFCSVHAFSRACDGPRWRGRGTEHILDEVELLVRERGAVRISFWDDNLIGPGRQGKERARELARGMQRRGLKVPWFFQCRVNDAEEDLLRELAAAGMDLVFLGIESANQRALDFFHKRTTPEQNRRAIEAAEAAGVNYELGYILFDPLTTLDEMENSARFWREIAFRPGNISASFSTRLEVLRGSPVEALLRDEGLLRAEGFGYGYCLKDGLADAIYHIYNDLVLAPTWPLHEHAHCLGDDQRPIIHQILALQLDCLEELIREARGRGWPAHRIWAFYERVKEQVQRIREEIDRQYEAKTMEMAHLLVSGLAERREREGALCSSARA